MYTDINIGMYVTWDALAETPQGVMDAKKYLWEVCALLA